MTMTNEPVRLYEIDTFGRAYERPEPILGPYPAIRRIVRVWAEKGAFSQVGPYSDILGRTYSAVLGLSEYGSTWDNSRTRIKKRASEYGENCKNLAIPGADSEQMEGTQCPKPGSIGTTHVGKLTTPRLLR